jgi:two-component system, OmpR family, alkaline phosphatase synthesis response regulator PhoP
LKSEKYKILLVDDDPDILEFVSYNLIKEGYQVYQANNGLKALSIAKEKKPHLIILDIMMPEMDGIETCNEIRKIDYLKDTVITFLTARNEDYSQIAGFEAGGDDYILKPIKPKVMLSRIKALLRRSKVSELSFETQLKIGDLVIDKERYVVHKKNEKLILPRKEFELLLLLASRPGKVFSRENILDRIWGEDIIVGDRTIDVHIRKLREKLGDHYIKTVKGIGYKFEL